MGILAVSTGQPCDVAMSWTMANMVGSMSVALILMSDGG